MIETLQNLKQTINERIKNPFIGAFFISWVIINWRPIFIILFSHDEIYNKIKQIYVRTKEKQLSTDQIKDVREK